jgi:hypothetical protein
MESRSTPTPPDRIGIAQRSPVCAQDDRRCPRRAIGLKSALMRERAGARVVGLAWNPNTTNDPGAGSTGWP